jgi:hypothetical protein
MTVSGFAGAGGSNLLDLGNALSMMCRATCDTASASLQGFVAYYDVNAVFLAKSEVLSFAADATLRLGNSSGNFICQRFLIDNGRARKARFFVTSVSAGNWSVFINPI